MNLFSLALILIQVVALYSDFARPSYSELTIQTGDSRPAIAAPRSKIQDSPERPDVYYIIPDAYPSDAWLHDVTGYDNSVFTDALKGLGFIVGSHTQANYGLTLVSLSSTLNMRYYKTNPTDLRGTDYLRLSIANSEVARYLQQIGYTYIQLLSGYLLPSQIADINRDFTPSGAVDIRINENDMAEALGHSTRQQRSGIDRRRFCQQSLVRLYLETTMLKPIADRVYRLLQRDQAVSYDKFAPERFLDTIAELASIAKMPEATFTLVHLLKPHSPVVFDKHGNAVDRNAFPSRREHLDELGFVNGKFIEMMNTILEESRHQPIIIFQSDHGSTHGGVATGDGRFVNFDVYSAYHLPDQYTVTNPRPFTNINTFPLILNTLFETEFPFKDNRLIELLVGTAEFPEQQDVTDEFAHE